MKDKLIVLLGSIRFWIVTTGSISAYLAHLSTNGFSAADLFNAISIWLGIVVGLGSIDSAATRLSGTPEKK